MGSGGARAVIGAPFSPRAAAEHGGAVADRAERGDIYQLSFVLCRPARVADFGA
jgi:hypothetical protein